jgi:hypothetical protein
MTEPEAGTAEIAEPRAQAGKDSIGPALQFVREHPVMILAGGLAIGALAAALIPRGNRSKVTSRAAALAELATSAALSIGRDAWDRAETAGEGLRRSGQGAARRLESASDAVLDRAGRIGGAALERAERATAPARQAARSAGKRIAKTATGAVRRKDI